MGFKDWLPLIWIGSVPLFFLNFAPKLFKGSIILFISLFERDWSPIIFINFGEFIRSALISRAAVPELPAFKIKLSLYLKLFNPLPFISQYSLFVLILTPSFFKQLSVLITSSDFNRLYPFDMPTAWDASNANRILSDWAPLTFIFLSNGFILLFMIICCAIKNYF